MNGEIHDHVRAGEGRRQLRIMRQADGVEALNRRFLKDVARDEAVAADQHDPHYEYANNFEARVWHM